MTSVDTSCCSGSVITVDANNPVPPNKLCSSLTPWSIALFDKLAGSQLVKKFTALYGTWMFINAFTSARLWYLCLSRSIQSMPPPPPLGPSCFLMVGFNIIVPSAFRSSGGLHPSRFPIKTLYEPHYHTFYLPVNFTLLDLITRIIFGEERRWYSPSLCSLLHPPVTSSLLRPDIFSLSYSRTPSVCVPLAVWETELCIFQLSYN